MMNCIFCDLVSGKIPTKKIYEDEYILAFNDLEPKAPVHILLIPKKHIESLNNIGTENSYIISRIFELIPKIASDYGLLQGYRLVSNCLEDAGQSVNHLHFHLLGGRKFQWPPG